jgi:adenylate cyclase
LNPGRKLTWNWLGGAIGALLAVLLGLILDCLPFGRGLVNHSYDLFFAPRLFAPRLLLKPDEVRIVYLDDESHRDLNQPLNKPWDRALHARLLDYLKKDNARAVVFDIVFSDPGHDAKADAAFATALHAQQCVVLAADAVQPAVARSGVAAKELIPPFEQFRGTNVVIGSDELAPDDDLVIRRQTPSSADDLFPCIGWATLHALNGSLMRHENDEGRERWLNYYGPPLTIPSLSYYRIFTPEGISPGYFSNRIVFVGGRISTKLTGERKDEYPTPYTYWLKENAFSPGVEVQATIFLNLLRGDGIVGLPYEAWWLGVLGALAAFGLVQLRPLAALGSALGIAVATMAMAYYLFVHHNLLVAWLIFAGVQVPLALAWSVVFNSVQLYVQNRLYRQTLRMFLPPRLVEKFAANRSLLAPGAEKQTLTLCFSDIADFTSLSEGMDPDELAALMNAYFQAAVETCIHPNDGTVSKFMGDAIFAFWNAPDQQHDHALRACKAALGFRELTARPFHGRILRTRIGLHTGVANVGNFGSEQKIDYTALGENVNLASRLEGLNKFLGTECLMSAQTKTEIADRLVTRAVGNFRLKGFEGLVAVHELVGWPEQEEETRAWREAFAKALRNYQERRPELAAIGFRQVLQLKPDDGPASFYLKQIAERAAETVNDQWATFTVLKEK